MQLVADANVLLAAVVGGAARRVFTHPDVAVRTTATVLDEVQEYLPLLARRSRLPIETALLAAATLPVTMMERATYAGEFAEAKRRKAQRDPDDVELLALALHLKAAVWSNDDDFRTAGVTWLTTAQLLKRLEHP